MKPAFLLMSDFELKDLGGGRFELIGEMSFVTAERILEISEKIFTQYELLEIDMSQVSKADSAGLALMLEWKAQASRRSCTINYIGVPDSLLAIAKTSEVSNII